MEYWKSFAGLEKVLTVINRIAASQQLQGQGGRIWWCPDWWNQMQLIPQPIGGAIGGVVVVFSVISE